MRRLREELSQLRLEAALQREGWQSELSVAREEQRTLRAEIEEQSLSTVELARPGQWESQRHSWILEEPFLVHPDIEELMASRSELNALSARHEQQKQDWCAEMASTRQELEEALAAQLDHAELQEELVEAKAAAQAQGDLQGRLRSTCSELEEVRVERKDVHEELRRTRVELEALLETRQRQGADFQGELLRMRSELSSVRQRQGQQWELQEELRQSQADRERLARALREQGKARGDLADELSRLHDLFETAKGAHCQKVQALQEELSRARSAADTVGEETRREAAALQEELLTVRAELASVRVSQARQHSSRPSLHQRPTESPTRPHWAQHPPSLPPPPTRRSLGCQAGGSREEADERSSGASAEELRRVTAERDELAARMQRQEAVQDAILHTCEELEAGYMATKRQHQDLRGELRRVCQERDRALKKLNADSEWEEDRKLGAGLCNYGSQASARGRSAPPAPAPPPYLLVAAPRQPPIAAQGSDARHQDAKGDSGSPAVKSLAMTPGHEEAVQLVAPPTPPRGSGSAVAHPGAGLAAAAAKVATAAKVAARVAQEACASSGEGQPSAVDGQGPGPPAPASWLAPPAAEQPGRGGSGIPDALRRLQGLTDELLGPLAALAAAGRPEAKENKDKHALRAKGMHAGAEEALQQQATPVKASIKVAAAAGG